MAAAPQDVAAWAYAAGWRGTDLVTAVAVAYSETGATLTHAGGLWNVPGGPADGPGNAAAAYARYKSGGWKSWPTFRNGKFALFVPLATPVAASVEAAAAVKGTITEAAGKLPGGDLVSAAENALTLGYKTGSWVSNRHNWVRVAYVLVGGGLMLGGLILVAKPAWKPAYDIGKGITKAAATKGIA